MPLMLHRQSTRGRPSSSSSSGTSSNLWGDRQAGAES
jgi:hypothetical protein